MLARSMVEDNNPNEFLSSLRLISRYSSLMRERVATSLKAGNTGANHPFMQDYMQDFIAKIDQARGGAAIEPPRYFYAGKLSGGCTNCHKVNR
jgi:hypothetical protein